VTHIKSEACEVDEVPTPAQMGTLNSLRWNGADYVATRVGNALVAKGWAKRLKSGRLMITASGRYCLPIDGSPQ
jgi:hypothetical protein